MKWISALVVAVFVLVAGQAGAEECAPDYDGVRRVVMDHDSRSGVWIAAPVLSCMLRQLTEYPLLLRRVSLLEDRLQIRDDQVERLREVVSLAEEGERVATTAMERAIERAVGAEDRASVWWRAPSLWVGVGAVLAVGVVVLAAWAWSQVSD